jgi:hypothetical protein
MGEKNLKITKEYLVVAGNFSPLWGEIKKGVLIP